MSNSSISRGGSLMGAATMSNNVCLPPRSIGGIGGGMAKAGVGFSLGEDFINIF
jgi:hypothetical protein